MFRFKFVVYKLFLYSLVLSLMIGCASTPKVTNLTPAQLLSSYYNKPELELIKYYEDPSFRTHNYSTFSLMPVSKMIELATELGVTEKSLEKNELTEAQIESIEALRYDNEIITKQMAYFFRNVFEEQGYKFVQLNESPDFIVTFYGSANPKSIEVKPRQVTIPSWEPSKTITTNKKSDGLFSFNELGDLSSYGWGNWSGSSSSSTTIPGHLTTKTYIQPGYTEQNYYPKASVIIFDLRIVEEVAQGIGVGISVNPDIRISSQFVIRDLISKMSKGPRINYISTVSNEFGLEISIFTNDGNNYLPTVMRVKPKSPAQKAGIKLHDMILSINGKDMSNKTLFEIIECLLKNKRGDEIELSIWRVDKKIDLTMTI